MATLAVEPVERWQRLGRACPGLTAAPSPALPDGPGALPPPLGAAVTEGLAGGPGPAGGQEDGAPGPQATASTASQSLGGPQLSAPYGPSQVVSVKTSPLLAVD